MLDLISHLESVPGSIGRGWSHDADGASLQSYSVVEFDSPGQSAARVYSTVGLSRHGMPSRTSQRAIYCELLTAVQGTAPAYGWLMHLANRSLSEHRPYLRGDTYSAGSPLGDGSLSGFYFTQPVYWGDALVDVPTTPPIIVVWAVPVAQSEMTYIAQHGWSAFEDLLVRHDPDLTDLRRQPVV